MAYHELNTGTLFTLSAANGQAAPRQWSCDTWDDVKTLCALLSATASRAFPTPDGFGSFRDCVPVSITVGPFNNTLAPSSNGFNYLPTYNQYLVTVQYQLLHDISGTGGLSGLEKWPMDIAKPSHPLGTVLTLRIRNSGQFLSMMATSGVGNYYEENGTTIVGPLSSEVSMVILIPLREFHITCDRYTKDQLPSVKGLAGCVNTDLFLGCFPDTLLCESAEIDQSFSPDMNEPRRFRLTALFKERKVQKANPDVIPGGWNYEYCLTSRGFKSGFYKVKLAGDRYRYEQVAFGNFFGV